MKTCIFILIFFAVIACQSVFGQADSSTKLDSRARLVDEFGSERTSSEDRSARFDMLFNEMDSDPLSKAAIVFFCGKECYYGQYEAHVRGMITMKIRDRFSDTNRFVFIHGGYINESRIQIWMVPDGADIPIPESTVKFEEVKFKGLYKHKTVAYDCCGEF